MKSLENLTPEMASKLPAKSEHSCWHILYHIVYWQDLMLEALRSKKDVKWPDNNKLSWPTTISKDENEWHDLVKRFKTGLDEAHKMTENIESQDDLPSWPKVPAFRGLMVLAQHNAYHIGEIVATRQALGFWPPSPDHKVF
ncbi:MAG: DinB family protein [Candidatus Thorarchaeota archaeon]